MSNDNRYPLVKMEVNKKVKTSDFPRKKDRPSGSVMVERFDKPYGKDRKRVKRAAAIARQAESIKMSPQERLAYLDEVLGKGLGAKAERARNLRKIEKAKSDALKATLPNAPIANTDRNQRINKQKKKEQHDRNKKV